MEDTVLREQDSGPEIDLIKYAKDILRYLIHGMIISLIVTGITLSLWLIFASSLLSNLLLFVTILFLGCFSLILIGRINEYTINYLWEEENSKHWLSLMCHGFILSLGSLLIWLSNIVFMLIAENIFSDPIISRVSLVPVVLLIALVNGLYGKNLANYVTHISSLLHS